MCGAEKLRHDTSLDPDGFEGKSGILDLEVWGLLDVGGGTFWWWAFAVALGKGFGGISSWWNWEGLEIVGDLVL
jgi:hypothetical protein